MACGACSSSGSQSQPGRPQPLSLQRDCRIHHRSREVIDIIESPEEKASCRFVVPVERGVTYVGSVHKNEREVLSRDVQTEDRDPIGTLLEQVRGIRKSLLKCIVVHVE